MRKSKGDKLITRADKIRLMSDEELAVFLYTIGDMVNDFCNYPQPNCSTSDDCIKCLLNWLRK